MEIEHLSQVYNLAGKKGAKEKKQYRVVYAENLQAVSAIRV